MSEKILATFWTWAGDTGPGFVDEASPVPLEQRVAAALSAGWNGLGLTLTDLRASLRRMTWSELQEVLSSEGIERLELEFLTNWWEEGALRRTSDLDRHDLFMAAEKLGVDTIKVGAQIFEDAPHPDEVVDEDRFVNELRALGREAGERGLRIAVEPMPMSNVRSLDDTVRILERTDSSNVGVALDVWHLGRAGWDYSEIPKRFDLDQVLIVELSDASEEVNGSLWDDTVNHRLLPGDGSLRVREFVSVMDRMGWLGFWGSEVISAEYRKQQLSAFLPRAAESVRSVLSCKTATETAKD